MEIQSEIVEDVSTLVTNFHGLQNEVIIFIDEEIQEIVRNEPGIVRTYLRDSQTSLRPFGVGGFNPSRLSEVLNVQQFPQSRDLGESISSQVNQILDNEASFFEPLFVVVNVRLLRVVVLPYRGFIPTPIPFPWGGILQRLVEEQRVEAKDLEETSSCPICFENLLLEGTDQNNIIQMPQCLHMFHQDCLFEWLARKNSCPMCRSVPYAE